jgi:hypothetical protein
MNILITWVVRFIVSHVEGQFVKAYPNDSIENLGLLTSDGIQASPLNKV